MIDMKGMSDNIKKHLAHIAGVLQAKANSKTLGDKWRGEIVIKIHMNNGGISNTEIEAIEKLNKK